MQGNAGLTEFTPLQIGCWLVASALSLAACFWLLYRLCKVRGWVGGRVFPKQLLSLGVANLLLSGGALVYVIVYSTRMHFGSTLEQDDGIFLWFNLWCGMRFVAVFQEAQIATVLLYQACRWQRAVCFFGHWLIIPSIWIGGFGLGLIDLAFHAAHPKTYPGSVCVAQNPHDPIKLGVLLAAFTLCIVSNVAVAFRALGRSPSTVVRAAFKRVGAYPASFLFCYLLTIIGALWPSLAYDTYFKTAQYTLEFLSGAFNAAVYAWTYRYAISLSRRGTHRTDPISPRRGGVSLPDVKGPVEVGSVDIVEFLPYVEGDSSTAVGRAVSIEEVSDTTEANLESSLTSSGPSSNPSSHGSRCSR